MSNSKVAEKFADGKTTGSSLHMFIDGDTVFSYGYHFPIACRTGKRYNGIPVVLFTTRGYSNTTARHKSHVYRALSGLNFILEVDLLTMNPANWLTEKAEQIANTRGLMDRARLERNRDAYKGQIFDLERQVKIIKELFINSN